jgi:hypothetical protein
VGSSPTPGTIYRLETFAFCMYLAGEIAIDGKIAEPSEMATRAKGRRNRSGKSLRPHQRGKSIRGGPLSRSADNSVRRSLLLSFVSAAS